MKHHITIHTAAILCAAAVTFATARAEDEAKPIAQDKVPAAALTAIKKFAGEGTIEKIVAEKDGKTLVYEALIKGPGKAQREVSVTADGKIEGEEEVIALADAPEKVRAAIETHAKGGKVVKIERIKEDGETVYEVEFKNGNKTSEVVFEKSGKVKPEEKDENDEKK